MDNNKQMFCELCGADDVKQKNILKEYCVPFGSKVSVSKIITECSVCGAEIDLTEDAIIEDALVISAKESVKNILDYLKKAGYSLSYIERALELPQRTLSRWKSKTSVTSASAIALLRIIRTYPWIIDVSENHFDNAYSNFSLIKNGTECFSHYVNENTGLSPSSKGFCIVSDNEGAGNNSMTFFKSFNNSSSNINELDKVDIVASESSDKNISEYGGFYSENNKLYSV